MTFTWPLNSVKYIFLLMTQIYYTYQNPHQILQRQLNLDLRFLYNWLLANKISLNCAKTEFIVFLKPGYPCMFNFKIKVNGHRIFPSDSINYLGIYLDATLSGNTHCSVLIKKLIRANGMFTKVRHFVPSSEISRIYHAIFSLT